MSDEETSKSDNEDLNEELKVDVTGTDKEKNKNVVDVENIAFAAAKEQAQVRPWTKRMIQLYCFCILATLNSCITGYDGSLMSAINDMNPYLEKFNMISTGAKTGFVFAIYTVGGIAGVVVAGPLTDTWGRRWGMVAGGLMIIFGTCIQATANTLAQFIGGRFVSGFGVSTSATAGPSYVAEIAHPVYRGTLTAIYNSFWFIGSIPALWVSYGTNLHFHDDRAWRIPLWLQMVFSGIVVFGALLLPESPRWLMSNGRHEEALAIMARYHGEDDPNNPIVQLTYYEMQEEITHDGSDKRWWDYSELGLVYLVTFGRLGRIPNIRSALWRLLMVVSMAFFGQWAGNAAISYFLVVMLQQAGIEDNNTRLMLNAVLSVISFIGAMCGSFLVDKVGRRKLLFTSSCLFVIWFSIVTALSANFVDSGNKAASNVTVAIIYLFGFTFSVGFTPLQALYPVECLSFETRAKGMAVYSFAVNIASFFNHYVTPIGLGEVEWRFYFLYIAWDIFQAGFIYQFYVETKNRTLEELNEIFASPFPKKASFQRAKVKVVTGKCDDFQGVETVIEASA
ncbi:putative MFS lactose permease [Kalaharituber pfeilii]|nr:putative MFS lactose permease [Kalaharituber pfeilii]